MRITTSTVFERLDCLFEMGGRVVYAMR